MGRFRFRIASLLFVTLVCAIVLAATRPFAPSVLFSEPEHATYTGTDDTEHPCCHVTVTNDGMLPIWIPGHSGLILTFAYQGNPSNDPMENLNWLSQTPTTYTALYHGQSAIARIPKQSDYETAKLGVQLMDWRGRTADRWSDEFAYPDTQLGGEPSVATEAAN